MTRLRIESLENRNLLAVNLVHDLVQVQSFEVTGQFANLGELTFFSARDQVHGHVIWRTDGTDQGTQLVEDVAGRSLGSRPEYAGSTDQHVFYLATENLLETSLWSVDAQGTAAKLTNGYSVFGPAIVAMGPYQDGFAFATNVGSSRMDLWITDGTPEGTRLIDEDAFPFPARASVVGEDIYATATTTVWRYNEVDGVELVHDFAEDGTEGYEILASRSDLDRFWVSYGATFVGSELWAADSNGQFDRLGSFGQRLDLEGARAVGDNLFFRSVFFSRAAGELWYSDGTPAGTQEMSTLDDLSPRAMPGTLEGQLLLATDNELHAIDVSEVQEPATEFIGVLPTLDDFFIPTKITTQVVDDVLFYLSKHEDGVALNRYSFELGPEIVRVLDQFEIGELWANGSDLYFGASKEGEPWIWFSDGTNDGTKPMSVALLGNEDSRVNSKAVVSDKLLFTTMTGPGVIPRIQTLWADGGNGPEQIAEFDSYSPLTVHSLGDRAVIVGAEVPTIGAFRPPGTQYWVTDGTSQGTRLIADEPGDEFRFMRSMRAVSFVAENRLYSIIDNRIDQTQEIWVSDGTGPGTDVIHELGEHELVSQTTNDLQVIDDTVVYATRSTEDGRITIWQTGPSGTVVLTDPLESESVGPFAQFNDEIYFFGDIRNRSGVWVITDSGPTLVLEVAGEAKHMLVAAGRLFVSIDNEEDSLLRSLWSLDTAKESQLVQQVRTSSPFGGFFAFYGFAELGNQLLFSSRDGGETSLWRTDGSKEGTTFVRQLGHDALTLSMGVVVDDVVYFRANDKQHGAELWVSDGTSKGTMVYDIHPGPAGSFPHDMVPWQDALFFTANDGVTGQELWRADHVDRLIGDIDGDGEVAFSDFLILSTSFGQEDVDEEAGDLDGDRDVDFADFLLLSTNFGVA